ncbi:MAG: YbaB/EbfC family nucleoid-associated protein [Proteobacteria bacterium]|nr:YbaB/EbfC family nucleoid-associated protein [Pseudomonadota bacterium]
MDSKDIQSMMANLMQNAQKLQENMRNAYQEVADNSTAIVQGKAGGDLVVAHVNLKMQVTKIDMQPALFEEKPEVIAELVAGAVNQGLAQAQAAMKQEMMQKAKNLGLPAELLAQMRG